MVPGRMELAQYLAGEFGFPEGSSPDLARVAQFIAVAAGDAVLQDKLLEVYGRALTPSLLHRFFAALPAILRERNQPPHQLLITTEYDGRLERAFAEAEAPVEVVSYIKVDDQDRGFFRFEGKDSRTRLSETDFDPREVLRERSVIVKIQGTLSHGDEVNGGVLITEDDYIEYLVRASSPSEYPGTLAQKVRSSHVLILGCAVRSWGQRALIRPFAAERRKGYKSWAIQFSPDEYDRLLWSSRGRGVRHATRRLRQPVLGLAQGVPPGMTPGVWTRRVAAVSVPAAHQTSRIQESEGVGCHPHSELNPKLLGR